MSFPLLQTPSLIRAVSVCISAVFLYGASFGAAIPDTIPAGAIWVRHMQHDLLRFWTTPDALGSPVGHFPRFLLHDGTSLKRYLREHPEDRSLDHLKSTLDWIFPVAYSRQVYLYCVGYHMTGDPKLLVYAKAGLDRYLRICRRQDGAFRFWIKDEKSPEAHSTNLDCVVNSYAILGPAMYYYLTRDPEMLHVLRQTKEFIFHTFSGHNPDWKTLANNDEQMGQSGLGCMLDVINAFMFLTTPMLAMPERQVWEKELHRLITAIRDYIYMPHYHSFRYEYPRWGKPLEKPEYLMAGMDAKMFWYFGLYGRRYNDSAMIAFSMENARIAEKRFLIPEKGMWARGAFIDGRQDASPEYWQYNEMDQLLSTCAIADRSFAKHLPTAYKHYLEQIVDTVYGGICETANDPGSNPVKKIKVDHWKRDYHPSEHALVSYITSYAIRKQPVILYFAFKDSLPASSAITPYHFNGRIAKIEHLGNMKENRLGKYRLVFEDVY
jgi:mannose/cellobiose epimerase-like protein (N-acyl-D-glucosamine 2-epimerase family)